jgi:ATP-binding cassette subfamily B protein
MLPTVHRISGLVQAAESRKGSFLVETLHGMRTVKSLALEPRRRKEWDRLVGDAVHRRYDEASISNLISTVLLPLERLMSSGVLALAVYMAISSTEQIYSGALIGFIMLASRVSSPLVELARSINGYDEARLAVEMIRGMVEQPKELGRSQFSLHTPLRGQVEFQSVTFAYPGSIVPALDNVSFTIPEGKIFGIMGRSGSGKTTVTRLLQMLNTDYRGQIRLDGRNLNEFNIDHLRSSVGVVLQDNFLFSGTISESISATKPNATYDEIVHAARLAGAEEFIDRLPDGYNTYIHEGSTNLSGGQRQRLAIARALISDPKIVIFDEATSALDADSEAIVNANLFNLAKGRTVIIITHRLSSLVVADSILVLERGKVYDLGRHDELMVRCDIYRGLWHQQHRHLERTR